MVLERGRGVKGNKVTRRSPANRERTVAPPARFELLQDLGGHDIRHANHAQLTVVTKGNSFRSSARTETLPRKKSSSNLTVPAGTLAFSRLEALTLTPTRRPCVAISRSTLNDMHCTPRLHRSSPQPGEAGEAGSSTWTRIRRGGSVCVGCVCVKTVGTRGNHSFEGLGKGQSVMESVRGTRGGEGERRGQLCYTIPNDDDHAILDEPMRGIGRCART